MTRPIHPPTFTVPEWKPVELKGLVLTDDDRLLATRLTSKSRLSVDELRDGLLRITARSWVGVVRFKGFDLQIVPKLVGDNLGLVELIDYASGLDTLDRHPAVRTIDGEGNSLFDLIALLLVEACERVARSGLLSDYREIEDDLPVVRGRLLVKTQVLKRFGMINRLECRYDEHVTDIPENQIILAALFACSTRVVHPAVSMRVRRMLAIFSEVCVLDGVDLRMVRSTLLYNRLNDHYREPHDLAWLILDGLGINDVFAAGSHRCFAFLLDMNRLFESFVSRWLGQFLTPSEFRVIPQHSDRTIVWDAILDRSYSTVIPDLLVERKDQPGRYLPIDAKYKLYDERTISSGDVYQTFLYAYAYGEQHSVVPTAVILYPFSSPGDSEVCLHIRRSSGAPKAQLRALPIHIPSALREARAKKPGPVATSILESIKAAFPK